MNWLTWMAQRYSYTRLGANVGIPRLHIEKYSKGILRLPAGRYTSLRTFYQKVQYNRLRQSGFSVMESKRFSTHSVDSVDGAINRLRNVAEKIGSREGVNPVDILGSLSKSRLPLEDLERVPRYGSP